MSDTRPAIRYAVSFPEAAAHLIDVTLEIPAPDPAGQRLSLANWIPGSYMIRDFSRNVVRIRARSDGEDVPLDKLDKSTWRAPPVSGPLVVEMQVYAWELSVRAAHVDRTHAFFNGTSVFLCPEGQEDAPVEIDVARPAHDGAERWKVATAMDPLDVDDAGFGRYGAADHDELIDHPFELGTFTRLAFDVAGVPHEIVLTDAAPFDEARLVEDLARICEHHVRFFGAPAPMKRYAFLTMLVASGYGGLEHRASTALLATREHLPAPALANGSNVVGRANGRASDEADGTGGRASGRAADGASGSDGIARDDKYVEFLGLCSHEYFHTWNVKRIKPARFVPYALAAESYTRLLWFFEGVTSYYDDLALVRAGLIDRERYLELLGRTITRVRRGPGRLRQTVTESSFDAWHKFYKQDENAPNAIVSYYAKGALVALCLDARLREATGGRADLDTLMQVLWARWLVDGAGLAEDEPERVAAEIAGKSLDDFFHRALHTTEELPLDSALETLGATLAWRARDGAKDTGGKPSKPDATTPPWLGAALADAPNGARVAQVLAGGPAERAGLAPGDVVVALAGFALDASGIDAALARHANEETVAVHHFRLGRLLESRLPIEPPPLDTAVVTLAEPDGSVPWLDAVPPSSPAPREARCAVRRKFPRRDDRPEVRCARAAGPP